MCRVYLYFIGVHEEQNVLKRNRLVACHTDLVLIINVEIKIFRPDMNETYP